MSIYPLSPVLADMNSLEAILCDYAQALEADEFRNPNHVLTHWITKTALSKIALLLAVLATGAHFSPLLSSRIRLELCLDFSTTALLITANKHGADRYVAYTDL